MPKTAFPIFILNKENAFSREHIFHWDFKRTCPSGSMISLEDEGGWAINAQTSVHFTKVREAQFNSASSVG
jgi:hypothetical protein